jgi:tetratricopeptide (TPR) repeat protein
VAIGALASALLLQEFERPVITVEAADAKSPAADAKAATRALPLPRAENAAVNRADDTRVANEDPSSRIRAALNETADGARPSELLAELNAAYARGDIGDEDLVRLLLGVLLSHGKAEAALDLVTRFRPQDSGALVQIAVALTQQGKQALAQEAISRALAIAPENDWVLNQYAALDPAGALPYFQAKLLRQEPPGDSGLRLEIARLLENSGRTAEARGQLDTLLRLNPRNTDALQFLANLDPTSAERLVRDLIASEDHDNNWQGFLFQLVIDQGRTDDALALLDHDRARGVAVESGSYGMLAQKYLELQKNDAAIDMWSRAFDAEEGDPDNWTAALQEYAPEKLLTMLEARTAQGANDEFWGALGDSYWRAGRRAEALNAWREAARLDPEDGEWSSKLAAVAAGLDPL